MVPKIGGKNIMIQSHESKEHSNTYFYCEIWIAYEQSLKMKECIFSWKCTNSVVNT